MTARRAGRIVTAALVVWPLLAVLVHLVQTSSVLAGAYGSNLLLLVALANRFRRRLVRALAAERSRARVDALTNAPNRYALAEALASEQARICRGGRTAAVCFLDLDRFKKVNDTYGYAAGDALLVDVYERLRGELRASDLLFRWGGEEFVVLAPHVEPSELADFAERLRLLLAARPFWIASRPKRITASVGATVLDAASSADVALEQAARLVRTAKQRRNTAVVDTARESTGETRLLRVASA
jgi:diguanylate cyclase (GGDEF)-like protein